MKNVMKKSAILLALGMTTVCAFSAVACGEPSGGGGNPAEIPMDEKSSLEAIMADYDHLDYTYTGQPCTVTMSHWDSAGPMEEATTRLVLQGFEKRYPTINVDLDIISDYADTYSKTIASGNLHDVFMVSDGEFALWAEGNKMQNLTPFLQSSTILTPELLETDMLDGAVERYQYGPNKTLLCFPKDIGPQVMYYNKDIFDRLGVDYPPSDRIMTIEEAKEMWKALTKVEANGRTSVYGLAQMTSEGLVWSAGGDYLNDARDAFPTEASDVNALRRAYQFLQDALCEDKFIPDAAVSGGLSGMDMFCAEKAATIIGGRWEVTSLRTMKFNWDIAYIPSFEGEFSAVNYWSGSVGYAMFNQSQNKEAAWKLIEYFGSPEGQAILAGSGFSIPLYESIAYDENVVAREKALGPQNYNIFIESAKHQPAGTHTYLASQRWLTEGFNALAANLYSTNESSRWTVDEYLEAVKNKVNSLI